MITIQMYNHLVKWLTGRWERSSKLKWKQNSIKKRENGQS